MVDDPAGWLFDESAHVGVDYSDESVVAEYDRHHEAFRDYKAEAERIAAVLGVSAESTVLDIGCGTGGISIWLARRCRHLYAVDVSQAMVDLLAERLEHEGSDNVTPRRAGLLTYEHEGDAPDAIVANICLHHLPDFWKQIALCRLFDLLKPGGRMFLADVVFDFDPRAYREVIDGWLAGMREAAGPRMADETATHVRDEFSTWHWVMRGMLERAGFQIVETLNVMPQMGAYVCSKAGAEGRGPMKHA